MTYQTIPSSMRSQVRDDGDPVELRRTLYQLIRELNDARARFDGKKCSSEEYEAAIRNLNAFSVTMPILGDQRLMGLDDSIILIDRLSQLSGVH